MDSFPIGPRLALSVWVPVAVAANELTASAPIVSSRKMAIGSLKSKHDNRIFGVKGPKKLLQVDDEVE